MSASFILIWIISRGKTLFFQSLDWLAISIIWRHNSHVVYSASNRQLTIGRGWLWLCLGSKRKTDGWNYKQIFHPSFFHLHRPTPFCSLKLHQMTKEGSWFVIYPLSQLTQFTTNQQEQEKEIPRHVVGGRSSVGLMLVQCLMKFTFFSNHQQCYH